MVIDESYVFLKNVRFYAYHGVSLQEQSVGANFVVSIRVKVALKQALEDDDLDGTINYASLFNLAREEMSKKSKLLEHVAGRIARRILFDFPEVENVDISIMKENPPMGADCDGAGVQLRVFNEKTM
jgi:dihydroneopterin aldolase